LNWVFESSCWIKLFNLIRVLKFNFSTRRDSNSKIFQLNSTLFKLSTRLELKYSTWCNQFNQTALVESKRLKLICRLYLHVYKHSNNRSINNSIMKHYLNSKDCDRCTNLATKIMNIQDICNFVKVKALISCFLAADCKINCKTDCKRDCKRLKNHSITLFIKNILQKSLHYNFKRLLSL